MLKQGLYQKLLQKLSPQQIQLMKLLQVPTAMLEQRIKEELESNPALEEGADLSQLEDTYQASSDESEHTEDTPFEDDENFEKTEEEISLSDYLGDDDDPYYKTQAGNSSADDEHYEAPITQSETFHEHLMTQISFHDLSETDRIVAKTIIGNIDDDGYLRRDISSLADDLAFSQGVQVSDATVNQILALVQDLDPPGVGARDLRECLVLQLKKTDNGEPAIRTAIRILEDFFEEFTKKHYDKIQRRLSLEDEDLRNAVNEILHLNPKPGSAFGSSTRNMQAITPDFILDLVEGELHLSLNAKNAPQLRISPKYAEMLESYSKSKNKKDNRDAVLFVKQKLDSAKWFIDAIRQRQETLMGVMSTILEYQFEYFREGDEAKLRPMILKDIADRVGLDISTVSRVANSKYIQTHFGTKLLKDFFSESLSTDSGEEVSTREVKKILREQIEGESKKKPLTDDRLTEILREKGYNIARRTVAKYREQLDIPVARLRKEL
jgi:RNA polymerase sigma-54 factor